jgi:hypothetical protein
MADEVWRLKKRVSRIASQLGEDHIRGILDSVIRMESVLADSNIVVVDHTGDTYRDGMRLAILHVEGTVDEERSLWIVDTVKPTVKLCGQVVREGQVILGSGPLEADAR